MQFTGRTHTAGLQVTPSRASASTLIARRALIAVLRMSAATIQVAASTVAASTSAASIYLSALVAGSFASGALPDKRRTRPSPTRDRG